MTPHILLRIARDHGCTRLLAKPLAKTDSSRQQIYLAGDFSALNLLPFGRFESDASNRGGGRTERLKAALQLDWITPDGSVLPAPNANLILYPKYPEVRLSGVLNGVPDRHPSTVIANKKEGRWLFLGIGLGMRILAYAAAAEDPCAQWALQNSGGVAQNGVFFDFTAHLLAGWVSIQGRLSEISRKGWIASKRLDANGMEHPCNSENCGGYTLEAELGIIPNARAEPDFAGWEVKQFAVSDLERPVGGPITLFTPEPDGGFYRDKGVEEFLRRYGRPNTKGTEGRLDFAGIHRVGEIHKSTGLMLSLPGWDTGKNRIVDLKGGIHLTDLQGTPVATWSFRSLIDHWKRKHGQAVFVPSEKLEDPLSYRFGSRVLAGIGTDFGRVLSAMALGKIYYDPAVKLVREGTKKTTKRRSQFRTKFKDLPGLYHSTEWWNLGS